MVQFYSIGWKVAQGPTTETSLALKQGTEGSWWQWRQRRFSAIGWKYVVFMVLIFSLSSAWSVLLIVLNLEPSKSANFILHTESLDHGHFWQSHKAALSIQATTVALLLVVTAVYWYLLYLLLVRPPSRRIRPGVAKSKTQQIPTEAKKGEQKKSCQQVGRAVAKFYRNVVSTDGKYRKEWVRKQFCEALYELAATLMLTGCMVYSKCSWRYQKSCSKYSRCENTWLKASNHRYSIATLR